MNKQDKKPRWTILNFPDNVKQLIIEYAKDNGYKIPRAIVELTAKELEEWKKKKENKQ